MLVSLACSKAMMILRGTLLDTYGKGRQDRLRAHLRRGAWRLRARYGGD